MSVVPRAGADASTRRRGGVRVVVDRRPGGPSVSPPTLANGTPASGMLTEKTRVPDALVDRATGSRSRPRRRCRRAAASTAAARPASSASSTRPASAPLDARRSSRPARRRRPGSSSRRRRRRSTAPRSWPPTITAALGRSARARPATLTAGCPGREALPRLRAGARGKVPKPRPPKRRPRGRPPAGPRAAASEPTHAPAHRARRSGSLVCLFVALARRLGPRQLLLVPRRRQGREQAPAGRCQAAAHATRAGALDSPTTILLLGTDHATPGRASRRHRHSDSIMLVRTDPDHHRLYYLSIPRDLLRRRSRATGRTGSTPRTSSAAPALAIRTIKAFTGLQINHVVIVDFSAVQEADRQDRRHHVDVPQAIHSNRSTARSRRRSAQTWDGWRFAKGKQHMDGQPRAGLLARPREPARPGRQRRHTRRSASSRCCRRSPTSSPGSGRSSTCRSSAATCLEPLATDLPRATSSSSAG